MSNSNKQSNFDIVPTHLAVEAMRDNGYKNAAHALAELMDNAIQAEATCVELLCAEEETQLQTRKRRRLKQIAVLDNGCGMDADTLRLALQFGNGTRLVSGKQSGIGRFGMGLPASSISQCTRLDVWSWRNGPESAIHTCLDLEAIRKKEETSVPEPTAREIPLMWRAVSDGYGQSGTLVVWSNLDRIMWRTASALIDNSEFIIGRLYRRFLAEGKMRLRLAAFDIDDPAAAFAIDRDVRPNDPGYLMAETSCPAPYHDTPMFEPWGGEHFERTFTLRFRNQDHAVTVRYSCVKPEVRSVGGAGAMPHGQHARKNVGISVVRADRELELDQGLIIAYDPRERWWGVEVLFPPSLDELFGVANNKQSARTFADMTQLDIEALVKNASTLNQLKTEMTEDEDPRAPFLDIVIALDTQIKAMRRVILTEAKGSRTAGGARHSVPQAEQTATARTRERQEEGHVGASDRDEEQSPDKRKTEIENALTDTGVAEQEAKDMSATTVDLGIKYIFARADLDTDAFFSVRPKGGALMITLNTDHPAYNNLVEVLDKSTEGASEAELANRLSNAASGLELLLMAWARYEDELPDGGNRKRDAQDARKDWGRIARAFLSNDD